VTSLTTLQVSCLPTIFMSMTVSFVGEMSGELNCDSWTDCEPTFVDRWLLFSLIRNSLFRKGDWSRAGLPSLIPATGNSIFLHHAERFRDSPKLLCNYYWGFLSRIKQVEHEAHHSLLQLSRLRKKCFKRLIQESHGIVELQKSWHSVLATATPLACPTHDSRCLRFLGNEPSSLPLVPSSRQTKQ
jgi:hypothetical protein